MARKSWNGSFEGRLPLLVTGLLAIVIAALIGAAYRQVRSAAVHATTQRLQVVTTLLVDLLAQSRRQIVISAQQVADRPAVGRYLRAPLARDQRDALAALQPLPTQTQILDVELWDANGTRTLSTRTDIPSLPRESSRALIQSITESPPPTSPVPPPPPPAAGAPPARPPGLAAVGAIRRLGRGDTLVYSVLVPVMDGTELLGYVMQLRRAVTGSPQGSRVLSQLIGSDASLFFGNASGDLWTDFSNQVSGPPEARDTLALVPPYARDSVTLVKDTMALVGYQREGGARFMAVPAEIPGTPWMVMVEFPQGPVVAAARAFLLRTSLVGLVLVLGGAATAWGLSRRMRGLRKQVAVRTRELQKSEAQLRDVTETAHDAIISAGADGTIAFWNPGAARLFGYQADEALGRSLTLLMPPRYHDVHREGFARYLATGEARVVGKTVELEGRRKDGTEFPIELSLAAARSEAGVSFTAVIRDITERKRIEQALRETNAELESFSYSVSHDLRAPLRAIHGFARILVEDHGGGLDPEARRVLGVIDDNTKRMGQLIDDLLAFSRLGRQELETARVDMTELVRSVADGVRRSEGDRALDIVVDPLPPARGDRDLLRQAITNLLQNAAKFTRRRAAAHVAVGARADGSDTVYYVKDNGAGFDQRYAGKLFGVFQRLHRLDEFEGTGVGLAIVQRIIHRHGGRVWAEGKLEEGATFFFTLPGATRA